MATDKNIELIKKLMALAERGVGGEKETAKKKMAELMAKYGVNDADLSDDVLVEREYKYHDRYERQLLKQIFAKINHERMVLVYGSGAGKRSILIFRATKAETIQAGVEYDFYRQLWKEEQDFLLECFVQKHELFRQDPDAPTAEVDTAKMMRMLRMMGALENKRPQRRIETSGHRP